MVISLMLLAQIKYNSSTLEKTFAVYNSFYEPSPHCLKRLKPTLAEYEFDSDLYGLKGTDAIKSTYLFSIKSRTKAIRPFRLRLNPEAAYIECDVEGNYYTLVRIDHFNK
jgi:hypothetical protein